MNWGIREGSSGVLINNWVGGRINSEGVKGLRRLKHGRITYPKPRMSNGSGINHSGPKLTPFASSIQTRPEK